MHIVLANQWFIPEHGGGVGRYNAEIANAYRILGHEVTVIAKRPSSNVLLSENIRGIQVYRLPVRDSYYLRRIPLLGRYVRPLKQLLYSWRVNQALRQLHEQRPIDVVEFAEINAEGFFYARAPQTPFVVRCHTPTSVLARYYSKAELDFDTAITAWCEKDLIRRATALTTPSRDMARVIAAEYGVPIEQIAVIPNALGFDEDPEPLPKQTRSDAVTILYVGRLERVKGGMVFAAAIPKILAQVPNARILFVGGDRPAAHGRTQRGEIERELEQAGLLSKVEFLGGVDQPVLSETYRRADICVVPSLLYESFSYTCAEGMAAGKPVVASRIGGTSETVEDGVTGLLVTPGCVDELAEAIIRLACDPTLRDRMGRAGREKVAREFDPVKIAQCNIQVYEQARRKYMRANSLHRR